MARPSTLTFEQVAAHADSLKANGIKPTARAIRDRVGTGSMATLLKHLQQWQGEQAGPLLSLDEVLSPAIGRAISQQITERVTEATALVTAQLKKVNFTSCLYDSPVRLPPSWDQTGTPGLVGCTHFHSSWISGSAS